MKASSGARNSGFRTSGVPVSPESSGRGPCPAPRSVARTRRDPLGHGSDLGVGETAHDEIHLRCPMPCPNRIAAAADIEVGARAGRSAHELRSGRTKGPDGRAFHLAADTSRYITPLPCCQPTHVAAPLDPRPALRTRDDPARRRPEGRAAARPPPRRGRAGRRVSLDLLFHLPEGGIARELKGSIAEAPIGEPVTLAVTVVAHRPPPPGRPRAPYKVLVEDETGDVTLVFFNAHARRMDKLPPSGPAPVRFRQDRAVGRARARWFIRTGSWTSAASATCRRSRPSTACTEGLSSRMVGRFVADGSGARAPPPRMARAGLAAAP